MPSPRFLRLDPTRQAQILDVAAAHVARAGPEAASYNQIIAEAGISKTSAYLYFDGKDDLVREVFRALAARVSSLIGPWRPVECAASFWAQLASTSRALQQHLAEHPETLALLRHAPADAPFDGEDAWFADLLANGQAVGVIRGDVPGSLLAAATRAVLRAGDAWVVAAMCEGAPGDDAPVWALLAGMWRDPGAGGGR
jgi:AcrR family transcriptional regulator